VTPAAKGPLANRPFLRRALPPVGSLVAVVLASIGGFVLLADVGPIEAAYWLISPANIGIHFREHAGPETIVKAFAVTSRVALVVASLWIGQTVVAALFGGQITEELKRVQQERTIANLENHTVVCGYGMFGRTVVEQLEAVGRDIVVIEREQDVVVRAERDGHLVVDGDAIREAVQRRAAVDTAETIVAGIDDTNANIQIAIVARELAPRAELIVRIGDGEYEQLARRAGADTVVIPEIMSGKDVAEELRG